MFAYLKRCFVAARSKLTPYCALATGLVADLPSLIHDYWGQLEAAIPHLRVYHTTVVVAGILLTAWARVRRDVRQ